MTERRREPQALGDIVRKLVDERRRDRVEPLWLLRRAWDELAAQRAWKGTRAVQWRQGTATIEVASPPLCAELAQFRRFEVLDALRQDLRGEIELRDIRFRIGAFAADSRNPEGSDK